MYGASNIAFVGLEAENRAEGFLSENGEFVQADSFMLMRESKDVLVTDSTISNYFGGFGALETTGLTITGNDVSGLQGDGFQGGGIQDLLIEGNYFHDFHGSTQSINHSDMVQLWSYNTRQGNERVTVRDNVFDTGTGAVTQTIFFGHEAFKDPSVGNSDPYQDVTIEGNVIYNGAFHGISVSAGVNTVVRDNTLLWNRDAKMENAAGERLATTAPTINISSYGDPVVENNIAGAVFNGNPADASRMRSENTILEMFDASSPNYVHTHFVNATGVDGDARDFELRPDSPLYGVRGAPMSSPTGGEGAEVLMTNGSISGAPMAASLSADLSRVDGVLAGEDTTYVWRLEDGRAFEGETFEWVFDTPGGHVVRLEMTTADGRTDAIERTIEIADPVLMNVDFSKGAQDLSAYGTDFSLTGDDAADGTFALHDRSSMALSRGETHLQNVDALEIDVTFRKDDVSGKGFLIGQHNRLGGEIRADGSIRFELNTSEGWHYVTTAPGLVLDTGWHDVAFAFDSTVGEMTIALDGVTVATGPVAGLLQGNGGHTIMLGKNWADNLEAEIAAVAIVAPESIDPDTIRDAAVPYEPAPEPNASLKDISLILDGSAPTSPEMEVIKQADFDGLMTTGMLLKDYGDSGDMIATGREGQAFVLDGEDLVIVSNRADALEGVEYFDMTVALSKDEAGGSGTVMGIHSTMQLEVMADGALRLWMRSGEQFEIRTEADLVSDTDWHEVGIRLDGWTGRMAILMDGEEVASGVGPTEMPETMHHHLVLGGGWGSSIEGRVDDFSLAVAKGGSGSVVAAYSQDVDWYAPIDTIADADAVPTDLLILPINI